MIQAPETCNSPDTSSNISGTEEAQAVKADPATQASWDTAFDLVETYGGGSKHFLIGAIAAALQHAAKPAPALPQDEDLVVLLYKLEVYKLDRLAGLPAPIETDDKLDAVLDEAAAYLRSQSAALASAREVIGDIEDYIANAQSHYATLFDRGQGIHGQPGYVVDAVWNAWTGKRLLADELSRAISDIRAAREWKER